MKRTNWRVALAAMSLFFMQSYEVRAASDLALVLAVDCSGSVDGREYALQIQGIAAAFRDLEIIAAASAGPHRNIAVNLMTWGDPDYQKLTSGWHVISSRDSAEAFAKLAEQFQGRMGGGTGLGLAVAYGVTLLETGDLGASRKVIDVSGDGRESWELREPRFKLREAQSMRAAAGVTVNGLAITTDDADLTNYYRANVAAGPGSFVMSVGAYEDYAEAIRIKLLREIRPLSASLD